MENESPENIFETRPASEALAPASSESALTEAIASELEEPRWSVISFERTEASGINYRQAMRLMNDLGMQKVAGLCIVTDEAAARLKG